MILLDTNVAIDAQDKHCSFHSWAKTRIAEAVAGEGASLSAVSLAELCVANRDPELLQQDLAHAGIITVDLPIGAAPICGAAYREYRAIRKKSRGGDAPAAPLPDFFIGAHAQLPGWKLATRDVRRFRIVKLPKEIGATRTRIGMSALPRRTPIGAARRQGTKKPVRSDGLSRKLGTGVTSFPRWQVRTWPRSFLL
jgi:predicted nucleic acid-binding protein